MKNLFFILILFLSIFTMNAQTPASFNYQGVARDAQHQIMANKSISLEFSILRGSETGTVVFSETHTVTTSALGIFSLKIGMGNNYLGSINSIKWSESTFWLQVKMDINAGSNFKLMGASQMISVPYALHAQTVSDKNDADADPKNEIQTISKKGSTIFLTDGGSVTDEVNDADADPNNEIQKIEFNVNSNILTLSNGGFVDLSTLDNDSGGTGSGTDDQKLSISGTQLSIEDGNSVDLSIIQDGTQDADSDPKNEIQSISKNGNIVSLSINGGSFTDEINDADADPKNEIQTLSKNGSTIVLSNGGSVTDQVNDADADPTNELQKIEFNVNSNILTLSNGGTVDLSTLDNDNNGSGTGTDDQKLSISGTQLSIEDGNSVDLSIVQDGTQDADADPNNEIQTISKNGNIVSLSNNGGSFTDETTDADADPNNEIQTISKNGNIVSLSNNGGSFTDETTDADSNPNNEIQHLRLNNDILSLSKSDSSVYLGYLSSPWKNIPFSDGIEYKRPNASVFVLDDDYEAVIMPDAFRLSDNTNKEGIFNIENYGYNKITSTSNNLIESFPLFQGTKDSLYFISDTSSSSKIVQSILNKDQIRFSDSFLDIYSELHSGSLYLNSTGLSNNIMSSFGLEITHDDIQTPNDEFLMKIGTERTLQIAEKTQNGEIKISGLNSDKLVLGKGSDMNTLDEKQVELNSDSLHFVSSYNNGFPPSYSTMDREKITFNISNFGNSLTQVGLDSIFMSKYIGILFPDEMTLKPSSLKIQGEYNQTILKNNGIQINELANPTTSNKRVELNSELTMYNTSQWKNISLGTPPNQNGGQLDLWSGTGDFKLARLGSSKNDALSGSLELFSYNSGYSPNLSLTSLSNHGEINLYGNDYLKVHLGTTSDGSRGFIGINDTIQGGSFKASMYIDDTNRGVVYADQISAGAYLGDSALHPLSVIQLDDLGIFLKNPTSSDNWEFYIDTQDGSLSLFGNNNYVGSFDIATGAYSSISDNKLKKDISKLTDLLPKLMEMKPSKYIYINNNPNNKESIGFIAQDVQKIFPQLVKRIKSKNGNELLSVDYSGFGVIAIKAIQEQQNTIETQQKKINDLESRLSRLENLLLNK